MASGTLTIDLDALAANYRGLDARNSGETAAVVKADGYGLGVGKISETLAHAGARHFFVATAQEGADLRRVLGLGPTISVFSGHMIGDTAAIRDANLVPMLNSPEQIGRHSETLAGRPYGLQLDTGMSRLGIAPEDWSACAGMAQNATLVMSHLACADTPDHPQNNAQLEQFTAMTAGHAVPRSLSATGGILLGPDYHFDLARPGIGLYGGLPFDAAQPVVRLSLPVIQTRTIAPGTAVGYGAAYVADTPRRIATLSSGYADGLIRALSAGATLWHGPTPCPTAGRVSMDMVGVDVTGCDSTPDHLDILGPHQGIDALADAAGTIGYEILTSMGARYERVFRGG